MLTPHARTIVSIIFLGTISVACVDATDPLDDRQAAAAAAPPPAGTGTTPGVTDPSCEGPALVRLDPTTWARAGSNAGGYTMEPDAALMFCNRVGVHMRSLPTAATNKFGTFMGTASAEPYRSKRVRLRATMRVASVTGWASMWLRIDGADKKMIVLDNMHERSMQGTMAPREASIVLDVPATAALLAYGVMLSGQGEVWASDIVMDVVGPEVAPTRE